MAPWRRLVRKWSGSRCVRSWGGRDGVGREVLVAIGSGEPGAVRRAGVLPSTMAPATSVPRWPEFAAAVIAGPRPRARRCPRLSSRGLCGARHGFPGSVRTRRCDEAAVPGRPGVGGDRRPGPPGPVPGRARAHAPSYLASLSQKGGRSSVWWAPLRLRASRPLRGGGAERPGQTIRPAVPRAERAGV